MIKLRHVSLLDKTLTTHTIPSATSQEIDATGLTLFPALIDPHVHFRTPGLEHKENWISAANAAIRGGITTVFDMPNTIPPTTTHETLIEKKALIDKQLKKVGIPLRYGLYLGADKDHFDQIAKCNKEIIGIKVFMGSSTGGLVMDDDACLETAFRLAAEHDLVLAIHAEDEQMIQKNILLYQGEKDPKVHSLIRSRQGAILATTKAIDFADKYKTRLYLLHIGTKEEVDLIAQAKEKGVSVWAETTPHHLFLSENDYAEWGTKVQMNPPLRSVQDSERLWKAIHEETIDTIGSDHAPHTLEEKNQPYGKAPSGIPGVETTLPLLLDAAYQGKISHRDIIRCMKTNVEKLFRLTPNDDVILVDLHKQKTIKGSELKTQCKWSPYEGRTLRGWPIYTILKGMVYDVK